MTRTSPQAATNQKKVRFGHPADDLSQCRGSYPSISTSPQGKQSQSLLGQRHQQMQCSRRRLKPNSTPDSTSATRLRDPTPVKAASRQRSRRLTDECNFFRELLERSTCPFTTINSKGYYSHLLGFHSSDTRTVAQLLEELATNETVNRTASQLHPSVSEKVLFPPLPLCLSPSLPPTSLAAYSTPTPSSRHSTENYRHGTRF